MTDAAPWSERLLTTSKRARAAALRLDSAELLAAVAELEELTARPETTTRLALLSLRAEVQGLAVTCRFLSQTLSDCLEAALGTSDACRPRRYERGGKVAAARTPALAVARYG